MPDDLTHGSGRPQRREVQCDIPDGRYDCDDIPDNLEEAIVFFQKLLDSHGPDWKRVELNFRPGYDGCGPEFELEGIRDETDLELDAREKRLRDRSRRVEAEERAEYERLRAKFGEASHE